MNIDKKLISLNLPYIHLIIGSKTNFYNYISNWLKYEDSRVIVRIIRGEKCKTTDDFFNEASAALQFPYYFGENWPAFDECINDLEWLYGDAYILFFYDFDQVLRDSEGDCKVLFKILSKTILEWTGGRNYDEFPTSPTPFHIVLHCDFNKEKEVKSRALDFFGQQIDIVKLES